jgi:hypothetical protein
VRVIVSNVASGEGSLLRVAFASRVHDSTILAEPRRRAVVLVCEQLGCAP